MYDIDFENKLIDMKNNTMIVLDEHVKIIANEIERRRNDVIKIVRVLYDFAKEGKGIKLGDMSSYHIYKHKTENVLYVVFRNPIEQRFFDVTDFGEYFKGVIIQNKDSQEIFSLKIGETRGGDNYYLSQAFVKGIISPTDYYHSHRGNPQTCYGSILDGIGNNLKFSFAQTMNNLLEGLRTVNFDDTVAVPIDSVNELCFFGYYFRDGMSSLTLESKLNNVLVHTLSNDDRTLVLDGLMNFGFYNKLKDFSTTHSYHKDCYCYYCTSVHLIKMDRDRIVFDELSRVVVTFEQFTELLDKTSLSAPLKLAVIQNIQTIKNKNFIAQIEIDVSYDDDGEGIDDYLYENLNELISELTDDNIDSIQECREINERHEALDERLDEIQKEIEEKKQQLSSGVSTNRLTTIEFLLGDDIERQEDGETEEIDDTHELQHKIEELLKQRELTQFNLDNTREELRDSDYYDLFEWSEGSLSDSDIRDNYSDTLYDMACNHYGDEDESETQMCDYDNCYRNNEGSGFRNFVDRVVPYSLDHYEHYEIKTNGELTNMLWSEKINKQDSALVDNLGELYIRQHNAIDMSKVRNTVTTIVGCGTLGSNIAYTMSRLGYRIFGLIDYDNVELHNLPNQYFFRNQISDLKARALKNNLLEVLPNETLPIIFSFEATFEKYREYNGTIPTLMNRHTDVFIMVTDNLESRYNTVRWIKELHNETAINYLVIDCRMNDLNDYVIYSYYINERECYEAHLRTMVDSVGELIKLESENVCGLQSSILVAQKCSVEVIKILQRHLNNEETIYLSSNLNALF